MFGGIARLGTRMGVARVLGIVAILFGILLLQGSLCDGGTTSGVPCVGSCDEPLLSAAADHHATTDLVVHLDAPDQPGDQDELVSLCVTVLLAVLAVLAIVPPSGVSLVIPQVRAVRPVARSHAHVLPALCALRL